MATKPLLGVMRKMPQTDLEHAYVERVFQDKIKEYNDLDDFGGRYIQLDIYYIMLIQYDGSWKYKVYETEPL